MSAAQGDIPRDGILHVLSGSDAEAADGSEVHPFADISDALALVRPGVTVVIHEGDYLPFEVGASCSGTAEAPVVIRAAEGECPVIRGGRGIAVYLADVDNIVISGLEISGGTHGIYYESTSKQGGKALENIVIRDCMVHDVDGIHGIGVYAANDRAPVRNIVMEGCEVCNCSCGSSESTVFNGNIDGFTIRSNRIHDNNNIGIDMIGFEGVAKHDTDYEGNLYDVDFVRNGKCYGNLVYGISSFGNPAYREGAGYDCCAGGIYVDGGRDIAIYDNFVFACDIGIEVATEHSPVDNPLFYVSGVEVYDNVIANCEGYCGLAFGGYAGDLGFTRDCGFYNNTLFENRVQMAVQRSIGNYIHHNLFVGGETGIEYNEDCAGEDMVNDFGENYFCEDIGAEEAFFGTDRAVDGFGSEFVPDTGAMAVYREYIGVYK